MHRCHLATVVMDEVAAEMFVDSENYDYYELTIVDGERYAICFNYLIIIIICNVDYSRSLQERV